MSQRRISTLSGDRPTRLSYGPNAPCVVAPDGPGLPFLALAGPIPPSLPARVTVLSPSPADRDALYQFGRSQGPVQPNDIVPLARAMARAGLRPTGIARLLRLPHVSEVSRWLALEHAAPALRDAVTSGQLTMTHARILLPLTAPVQGDWAQRAIRGRWSVRRLEAAIREPPSLPGPSNDADISALSSTLSERLGAQIHIGWTQAPTDGSPRPSRFLQITWYDIESLKGVLATLAAGPEFTQKMNPVKRVLTIALQDANELGALTDHLLSQD